MNKFEKISKKQWDKEFDTSEKGSWWSDAAYEKIKLPHRATKYSAGYDFFLTEDIELHPGQTIKMPTGIRAHLDKDKFLAIFPRSGLGFKYRLQLDNTVGIIDADYCNSDNEGHIWIKITNDTKCNKVLSLKAGEAIAQGVIMQYFTTADDEADGVRNGGFGSTSSHNNVTHSVLPNSLDAYAEMFAKQFNHGVREGLSLMEWNNKR